eukprot:196443_1
MAQQPLQPGDEKYEANEGTVDQNASKYGNYRCVFRPADADSLYLMMKDCKSKRAFSQTFSKSTLYEMKLAQPIDKVINLLQEAISGESTGLKFKIAFGDAENTKTPEFGKLSTRYVQGYALYILVSIDHSYFGADYSFKLLEQKRTEVDRLHDIIYDMQQEIDQMKKEQEKSSVAIASWYSNHGVCIWHCNLAWIASGRTMYQHLASQPCMARILATGGIATLHGAHLPEPTLEGMAKLADDKNSIIIGMDGLYRVTAEPNWTSATGAGHVFYLQVNGNSVATKWMSNTGGFGHIERLLNLKKNDKIAFNFNHHYAMNQQSSCFTVQKL